MGTIAALNLRRNKITDEGCRAIAAVLTGRTCIDSIDLRQNQITRQGIKTIVDSLERSSRVRYVHVHPGGMIEAFGGSQGTPQKDKRDSKRNGRESLSSSSVSSSSADEELKKPNRVCLVDVRENMKHEESNKSKDNA